MFKRQISIFKELFKINDDIGEEFKASAYREIYIKLLILSENKDFKNSYKDSLDFDFKNSLTPIEKLKFANSSTNLNFGDLFSEKTISKIVEIGQTGKLLILEDLKKDKNIKYIQNLTKIFGVGPVTAKNLIKSGIRNFKEYERNYHNFTKNQKIGIKYRDLKILEKNSKVTEKVIDLIESNLKKGESVHLAGSQRVNSETPSDIDLIICNKDGSISETIKLLEEKKMLKDYSKSNENDIMGVIEIDKKFYRIDIKCTTRKYLATYLLYFGSGKYFSKYIRKIAKEKGYRLNQYGIEDLKKGDIHFFRTETGIFRFLKLLYIHPVDRFIYW